LASANPALPAVDERLVATIDRLDAARLGPPLAAALASLPARARDPFLLHVLADLSYDEIAIALAVPVGTVRSRIARARTRLSGILDGGLP
jgi:RNA polymerase sigma-70 factor (ECF subfamily)